MGDVLSFRVARKGGYETADVDRAISEIRGQLDGLEQERADAAKQIDRLTRDLEEARSAVQRARAKPSFADLGSAFEQTLRLAEEQAAKMIREASAESKALRDGAKAEAEELRRTSTAQAEARIQEAEQKASETIARAERKAAEVENRADALLVEARNAVDSANFKAGSIKADAERYAADVRQQIHQETEDAKAEIALLRQIAERDALRAKSEIKVLQEQSEQDRLALHEEATKHVQARTEEADQMLADVTERANALHAEAQDHLAKAKEEAERILSTTRSHARSLLGRARDRATQIGTRTNEHTAKMLQDAELRLAILEEQRRVVDEYMTELRSMHSADALSTLDGTDEQLDVIKSLGSGAADDEPVEAEWSDEDESPAQLSIVETSEGEAESEPASESDSGTSEK